MELLIKLTMALTLLLGISLLFLSIFVLHSYEAQTKKRPTSLQFWPFNKDIKEFYPGLCKLGRVLQIGGLICALPYLVNFIVST